MSIVDCYEGWSGAPDIRFIANIRDWPEHYEFIQKFRILDYYCQHRGSELVQAPHGRYGMYRARWYIHGTQKWIWSVNYMDYIVYHRQKPSQAFIDLVMNLDLTLLSSTDTQIVNHYEGWTYTPLVPWSEHCQFVEKFRLVHEYCKHDHTCMHEQAGVWYIQGKDRWIWPSDYLASIIKYGQKPSQLFIDFIINLDLSLLTPHIQIGPPMVEITGTDVNKRERSFPYCDERYLSKAAGKWPGQVGFENKLEVISEYYREKCQITHEMDGSHWFRCDGWSWGTLYIYHIREFNFKPSPEFYEWITNLDISQFPKNLLDMLERMEAYQLTAAIGAL